LKEEELDHSLWRTCFGRGYGPVTRQTTDDDDDDDDDDDHDDDNDEGIRMANIYISLEQTSRKHAKR
jgi:hypothetical protein